MSGLLIGAGQLGSRHLQAMAATPGLDTVYVVERKAEARALAEQRWKQVPEHTGKRLVFTEMSTLTASRRPIDVAIIATPSEGRLEVLGHTLMLGIKRILCEKILFQSVALYHEAAALAQQHEAAIYVSHVLRYCDIYRRIRREAAMLAAPLRVDITVGNVGMGCNLVHQLDLFEYITQRPITGMTARVDMPLLPCKRGEQYVEFTGDARAHTARDDSFVAMYSAAHQNLAQFQITFADRKYLIDESIDRWQAFHSDESGSLGIPLMSHLTARIIPEMVQGICELPRFETCLSMNSHMLRALNNAIYGSANDHTCCPIT